jgi:hypothetical protein
MARIINTEVKGTIITFAVAGAGTLTLDMDETSAGVQERAMFHGMIQRIADAATGEKDAAGKFAAMKALVDHYATGTEDWSPTRTGGGGSEGIVVLAMQRVYGGTVAEQEAYIEKMCAKRGIDRKAALKVFAGADKIAQAVADIQAERAAARAAGAKVNADDLIAGV